MLSPQLHKQESFLTVQRIRAAQSRYWLSRIIGLWGVCTLVILMLALSKPARHDNWVSWGVANVVSHVRPRGGVNWHGQTYEADELARYLNRDVYHGSLWDWLKWAGGMAVLPVVSVGMIGLWWVRREKDGEQHIRGAEVLTREELQHRLGKAGMPGLWIAGVKIPAALEQSHISTSGATGAGKSVVIRSILQQYQERGEVCIVVDPEGEFIQEFYDEQGRGDFLINPFDARGIDWQPSYEGTSEADLVAQAASLFPILPGISSAAQFYHEAARRVYRRLLQHNPGMLPKDIATLFDDTRKAAQTFGVSREIISTLQNGTEFFRSLQPGKKQWSAREWVEEPRGWVFLTFRAADKEAALPFISLCLESLTRRLLSRPIATVQPVRIVIDELAVVKQQESLPGLLAGVRKRSVSVLLGFQDVHQLYPIYGKDLTHSMLNQPSTRLFLRTNDRETQDWCAGNIGRREVARSEQSETVGPENVRDSFHLSKPRRTEDAILGSEFGQFPNLVGVLKVAHYGAARVTVPYCGLIERVPAFVPRGIVVRQAGSRGAPLVTLGVVDLDSTPRKL